MTAQGVKGRIAAIKAAVKALVAPVVILVQKDNGRWAASNTQTQYDSLDKATAEIEQIGTKTIIIIDV